MAPTGEAIRATDADDVPDPAAEFAFESQVDRVQEEKRLAREAPDIPWRTWWFHSGSKWYVVLGFLIIDIWILSLGFETGLFLVMAALMILAFYGELLLYQYLYYYPPEHLPGHRTSFRRTWFRPVPYGRWTTEGEVLRAGGTVATPEQGPDPREFL
jgi:hypothetical protein